MRAGAAVQQDTRIHIPYYVRAGAVLVRISREIFTHATNEPDPVAEAVLIEHWKNLRRAIATVWHNESADFDEQETAELTAAFVCAHKYAHRTDATPPRPAVACGCPTALAVRDFALFVVMDGREKRK